MRPEDRASPTLARLAWAALGSLPTVAAGAVAAALVLFVTAALGNGVENAAAGPCDPPITNPIPCENSRPGTPESQWRISTNGNAAIRGFATQMSVDQGETVQFKIKTDASSYQIHIYRLGYYGGDGAREVAVINPSATLPQTQPACLTQSSTGLLDCGNWDVSASWTVPTDAVSGIYFARPELPDGRDSAIVFVVRDDDAHSDLLFQTSDASWQAYNDYGGSSFYGGGPNGRAYKASYNRPLNVAEPTYLFNAEYPTLRWLEANGYNVSYSSGVDTARRGAELLEHRVFLSVGHDEYWSGEQRANVEAARAAGVNLAFFSGNEVFWKTRWENSMDASATPYRTLVSYKETLAGAKIDPSPTWTGTWRDPRFSPPADGGRPENALTGTMFSVNEPRSDSIEVPAAYGALRFWRNTSVANLQPGQTATLPQGTLGYEWDSDVDNPFRPPGLFRLSSTTLNVNTLLLDYGGTYGSGTATHNLTLYRAASGALVFGAGTVQWAWGLDDDHAFPGTPADQRIRQATVNLFADMGVQAGTLQPGLVPASQSNDTAAPTSAIQAPSAGSNVQNGDVVTISGTAADSGGGVVAGVEVSTDGGSTWHPASGRESWSYSWRVGGSGSVTIKSRAVDDSGNLGPASAGVTVNVTCPCSLWSTGTTPGTPASGDTSAIEVGVKFKADTAGSITGLRFYKGAGNTGTHVGSVWTDSGQLLARATFANESASGWQTVTFSSPVDISANTTYIASYHAPSGNFALDRSYFTAAYDNAPLHAPASASVPGGNGVFLYSATPAFPTSTYQAANYWVDVMFTPAPPDNDPPTVTDASPSGGSAGVGTNRDLTVTFSEPMTASSISGSTFVLRDGGGAQVPAAVGYDAASRTATLDPNSALAATTTYTATVKGGSTGVKDTAGNPLQTDYSWSFTTAPGPVCPCRLWSALATPATASSGDSAAVEVGVKFRADSDGSITGIRFYKAAANTGTHVGSLWSDSGDLLARATFTGESASGWQTVTFSSPVAISANTTYVASYHAPNGNYSLNSGYFGTAYDNAPLHAPASGSVAGGNGVYLYSSTPALPTSTYGAGNYWVDVVFQPAPPDTTPPTVTAVAPAAGATNVARTADVKATFGEAMTGSSISGSTFVLRDGGGAQVPATVAYDPATRTATLDPNSALAATTTYTATVTGGSTGVKDAAGNALAADYSWSFTTGTAACPCSLWGSVTTPATPSSGDTAAVEVGVKFTADSDGSITGIRFYKGAGNTGTHVGSLWTESGLLLGRATFTGESAGGWQTVTFATPVAVTANTAYVASYHAPNGNYSRNSGYFGTAFDNAPLHAPASGSVAGGNGVYTYSATPTFPTSTYGASNYWVDLVFEPAPPDATHPTVTDISPPAGSTSIGTNRELTVTFDKAMNPATFTSTTFKLRDGGGTEVPTALGYDAATRTATLAPDEQLAGATTYTATVKGGANGVKDTAGNPLQTDYSWSFTTANVPICPCRLWSTLATPATPSIGDPTAIELGVQFRPDVDGSITGIRFYKGPGNTGTHVGSLWTAAGALLAQATFTNETPSGWQSVTFSSPVAVTADTTYVASYHAPNGNFPVDRFYFATTGRDRVPLHAPDSGSLTAGNGVYRYGADPVFPNSSYQASNYWVDVVFTAPTDLTPPTVTAVSPSGGSTSVSTSADVTATLSEPMRAATITGTTFTLRDGGGTQVPATVSYDGVSRTATLDPTAPLATGTIYTATVKGGATGVKDRMGNPLQTDRTWSFTTGTGAVCPCSLWGSVTTPGTPSSGDPSAVELGVKFRADTDGSITGIRFYKGPGNTGTHVGSLWTESGLLLGSAVFAGESASGWQTVTFATPIPITANTTYVASYHAPNGNFPVDRDYFTTAYDNAPLHAPASGAVAGGNGVYLYSAVPAFPTSTYQASNYWVDVVFTPSGG